MDFRYQGRDASGNKVEGNLEAASETVALNTLVDRGVTVTALQEQAAPKEEQTTSISWWQPRLRIDELILFTRQLYALTKAGIPIIRALNGLAESSHNPLLQRILRDVNQSLVSGSELSTAFRRHPDVFSPIYINLIQVGENTGQLDDALLRLVEHLELERETRKRMKSALRYPIMVISAISIAMVVINLFVIPAFANVFAKLGADLPLATRILMGTSGFFVAYWPHMLALLVVGLGGLRVYVRTDDGAIWWDKTRLRVPLIGSIFERIALGRFSRSFAMMMGAGVPILQCMSVVADSVGNRYIAVAIRGMRAGIERGERLTSTAASTGMFTPLVLQMLAVGEETGAIERLLNEVADFYEQEVDYELKRLADAIEPILLVFLGAMVLVLALGVFLPIWDLAGAAMGRG
ncbi:MSHA biogenesis protein MshG [Bacterioplanes sanyensis]|uniref:MSHA biogenesis protein MshG n=1 Tax=Bacterioplanes sanyensis TaxID=1249553 RepID=A0A222FEL2_9GAMM|nr:type II secretion system F family protein [Bacterioplanes sanyensis]ASP37179.1 MSHA biogenesis protein MshG [Bacterioplanes sanyensis]